MEIEAVTSISANNRIDPSYGQQIASSQMQTTQPASPIPTNGQAQSAEKSEKEAQARMEHFKQQVQKQLEAFDAVLAFRRDEESGKMVAELRNRATGEVLRQVPPEEMMHIAKSVREYLGLVVDVRR